MDTEQYTYEYLPRRGISAETHKFFDVQTQINSDGKPVSVRYHHREGVDQIRFLETKDFRFTPQGSVKPGGFCKELFPAGSSRSITITEGYDDAMSVWQMLGKYPVYSIRSSVTALSDVRADYEYLNSFEKIYLALDNDDPGQRATKEIAAVFGYGKIYTLKLAPLKDPNEYLDKGREKEFKNVWWNATRYMPDTIISSYDDIEKELNRTATVKRYPWSLSALQRMTGGIEIHRQYIFSGLEGTGKTEILHQTIADLLPQHPDLKIGLLLMEEPTKDTVEIQVGKYLKKPVHLPDYELTNKELMEHYKKLTGSDDRVHFFRHFGSEDTDVIENNIRFMVAACGCQIIVFDNYQHAVTGRTKDRDTEALDYLANRLEKLVKELPFALLSISHENDNELARGSRNITKEGDVWINIKRDVESENEHLRNIQRITFKKNRQAQKTGPAGLLYYDVDTATLSDHTGELPS